MRTASAWFVLGSVGFIAALGIIAAVELLPAFGWGFIGGAVTTLVLLHRRHRANADE